MNMSRMLGVTSNNSGGLDWFGFENPWSWQGQLGNHPQKLQTTNWKEADQISPHFPSFTLSGKTTLVAHEKFGLVWPHPLNLPNKTVKSLNTQFAKMFDPHQESNPRIKDGR